MLAVNVGLGLAILKYPPALELTDVAVMVGAEFTVTVAEHAGLVPPGPVQVML